jgi:hypothetical protein
VTTQPQQPVPPDPGGATDESASGGADATQPLAANGSSDATTQAVPATAAEANQPVDGGGQAPDQDATQRLEPVGKPRSPKAPTSEGKPST